MGGRGGCHRSLQNRTQAMDLSSKTHTSLGCMFDVSGTHTQTHTQAHTPLLYHTWSLRKIPVPDRKRMHRLCDLCRGKKTKTKHPQGLFGWLVFFSVTSGQQLIKRSSEFGGYERTQTSWERKDAIKIESFPWVVLPSPNHQQECNQDKNVLEGS